VIAIILSALSAGLPVVGVLTGIAGVDQNGNVDESLELIVGFIILAGAGCSLLLFPLSITSICVQPRWKAASILGLVVSICVLLLIVLLIAIAQ